MFCQNCGEKIDDGAKFCMKCGTAVNSVTVQNAAVTPSVPNVEDKSPESKESILPWLITAPVLFVLIILGVKSGLYQKLTDAGSLVPLIVILCIVYFVYTTTDSIIKWIRKRIKK